MKTFNRILRGIKLVLYRIALVLLIFRVKKEHTCIEDPIEDSIMARCSLLTSITSLQQEYSEATDNLAPEEALLLKPDAERTIIMKVVYFQLYRIMILVHQFELRDVIFIIVRQYIEEYKEQDYLSNIEEIC